MPQPDVDQIKEAYTNMMSALTKTRDAAKVVKIGIQACDAYATGGEKLHVPYFR